MRVVYLRMTMKKINILHTMVYNDEKRFKKRCSCNSPLQRAILKEITSEMVDYIDMSNSTSFRTCCCNLFRSCSTDGCTTMLWWNTHDVKLCLLIMGTHPICWNRYGGYDHNNFGRTICAEEDGEVDMLMEERCQNEVQQVEKNMNINLMEFFFKQIRCGLWSKPCCLWGWDTESQ